MTVRCHFTPIGAFAAAELDRYEHAKEDEIMSPSEDVVDVWSLDPIRAKPPAERYVLLWLAGMFESGTHRYTFRRSTPLPSLAEIDAPEELVKLTPPPTSLDFDDVMEKLKVMANLSGTLSVHDEVMEADIELNLTGRRAVAHLRSGDRADDPWAEVTMDRLDS